MMDKLKEYIGEQVKGLAIATIIIFVANFIFSFVILSGIRQVYENQQKTQQMIIWGYDQLKNK